MAICSEETVAVKVAVVGDIAKVAAISEPLAILISLPNSLIGKIPNKAALE